MNKEMTRTVGAAADRQEAMAKAERIFARQGLRVITFMWVVWHSDRYGWQVKALVGTKV